MHRHDEGRAVIGRAGRRELAVQMGRDLSQPNVVRYRIPATGAELSIGYADIRDPFKRIDIADACLLDLTVVGIAPRS